DRIQLQQVILNLILNGKDAMSGVKNGPRELLITSRKSKAGELVVAVRDSGRGLDPNDAQRIFDPFFTTKPEGMGLGLSISRTIIEAHGGTLWATQNENVGATIQFTLPPAIRSLAPQTTQLIAALEQLGPHDHFCSIYESPEEHYAVAIPFIRIGLDRGEKCIYIADDGMVGDVRQEMEKDGIDVDSAIASNALVLETK